MRYARWYIIDSLFFFFPVLGETVFGMGEGKGNEVRTLYMWHDKAAVLSLNSDLINVYLTCSNNMSHFISLSPLETTLVRSLSLSLLVCFVWVNEISQRSIYGLYSWPNPQLANQCLLNNLLLGQMGCSADGSTLGPMKLHPGDQRERCSISGQRPTAPPTKK